MPKYTLRFRAVNKDIFLNIKSGRKTVETRAASEKYRNIQSGDSVVLVCGKDRFQKKVKKAKIFTTVRSLLRSYNLKRIMPELNSEKNGKKNYINIRITKRKLKSLA
ncbi:MAG: hypothetical protein A2657_02160 [Candidatus Yanofskybacteria bacterium RIFCSPHIGHO2_01_FULL_44_110b]|uniref:ASCH domain-containing protein n=1 Tax=Candidatus Yanofskybacteria bacterium RIFCSPLOWO2_02_FULL_44_18 TaxID=1802705 RepID=A0A1F8H0A5_9BACT|nr:MAG: hypothetical protein A2657_02160 [Candidatus Yanofskybacteria bacterium RIFCSPHIGHO2_01_FULL_44_110b]OGN14105.1 MAG: hypothetical protein A3C01_00710 [Candidatus Yanofskybacteria bacterium RIFCSPHIGHO2_02_FULL_44_36b]OGN19290.1 MAG: hypothetical protein A3F50_03290 [Candidatus Yanofskybacteria bacterium RIFCSPHIGHO2_12_FULL_44_29b]OGN27028.1 MAG: hypothetical protein A3B12_00915 [Candidatus Yanofskybacteria bacterium RIFCSPLOWO2_01_FULL_44_88]OGN30971.1 MAG: hypothetical protein A3I96_0